MISLHISNRYLNLRPVVRKLAADAGVLIRICEDNSNQGQNKSASNWVLLARSDSDFGPLRDLFVLPDWRDDDFHDLVPQTRRRALGMVAGGILPLRSRDRWPLMNARPDDPLWTDDFSKLLKLVDWR